MADQEPTEAEPTDPEPTDPEPTENPTAEPDPPLNRAARRALRRGKKPHTGTAPGSGAAFPGRRDQVMGVRRRPGRRGNR